MYGSPLFHSDPVPVSSCHGTGTADTTINHHPVTAFDPEWIARYYGLDWNASGADGSSVSVSVSDSMAKAEAERLSAGKAAFSDSYTLSLRANLLRWATLTPDLGLEWRISPSVGIMVNGSWTSWTSNDNARRYALWEVAPEVRWYLGEKKAWYVGAMFKAGQFNYKFSGTGKQGDLLGGGITLKDTYDQATKTYYVYTADGLDDWATRANEDLTVSCILMDDIDYNDKEWTTIGTGNTSIESYSGTFDGGGHTIRNIKIKNDATYYNGLFGRIAGGGTVKNLTVENANLTTSGTKNYGIIAGRNDGTIENCVVSSCRITGNSGYVGCFSSENRGRISRCRVDDAKVSCYSFGGIVWMNLGLIEASSFQGHIVADGGALAETNSIGGTIIACWTDATHQEGKTVAGIVWYLYGGSVTACYYGGDMDAGILEDNTGNGDATKVGGSSFWTWKEAADLMNNELGLDFGWHWQTDNGYTPPTLVPNN